MFQKFSGGDGSFSHKDLKNYLKWVKKQKKIFDSIDTSEEGEEEDDTLSGQEFKVYLYEENKYDPATFGALFAGIDLDGDGALCFNEFTKWSLSQLALQCTFNSLDEDENKTLSGEEFKVYLK